MGLRLPQVICEEIGDRIFSVRCQHPRCVAMGHEKLATFGPQHAAAIAETHLRLTHMKDGRRRERV